MSYPGLRRSNTALTQANGLLMRRSLLSEKVSIALVSAVLTSSEMSKKKQTIAVIVDNIPA